MAIAPGFDYDLFVSYAHADDIAGDGLDGWVTQFVRHLQPALRQRLAGNEALKVFFDSQATSANYQLPELLVAAKRSALFLVVGSPSYAARNWPHQELETFVEQSPDLSRLFMIECMPLNDGEQYPAPLDRRIHVPFWKPSGPKRIGMPISPASDDFSTLVHGLASDIRERLLLILHSGSG